MDDLPIDETALSGLSMSYLDAQYERFLRSDHEDIPPALLILFNQIAENHPPDVSHAEVVDAFRGSRKKVLGDRVLPVSTDSVFRTAYKTLLESTLRHWFECNGHYFADLGLTQYPMRFTAQVDADGWADCVPQDDIFVENGVRSLKSDSDLLSYLHQLQGAYQGTIGYEYIHIKDQVVVDWFRAHVMQSTKITPSLQLSIYRQLRQAQSFEEYLGRQHVGQKRFSIEGAESYIVAMEAVIGTASKIGATDVVMGMAHRGRLNTMVNILGLPCGDVDGWFKGFKMSLDDISGDVKYHLGYSCDRQMQGRNVHLTLNFNPSHLESIVPVTMGVVRARQDDADGSNFTRAVLPILVHGDASVIGQGVVSEALNMSYTDAYYVGGAIHIVINNQIGFTTTPDQGRSSYYCTDFFKAIDAPVIHVNGDDPEAVYRAAVLAAEFRMHFQRDIVIDIITYRRHGHNEADEPSATSPLLYKRLSQHKSTAALYAERLLSIDQSVQADLSACDDDIRQRIQSGHALTDSDTQTMSKRALDWEGRDAHDWTNDCETSIHLSEFEQLTDMLCALPEHFKLQRQVALLLQKRSDMYSGVAPLNWGAAESVAMASLLHQRVAIRFVGQDVARGTFSHRHAIILDQDSGDQFIPLAEIAAESSVSYSLYNSTLSEFAALGFEYGYTLNSPKSMVVWEAQFGDFVNGAQVIIDQYITSAWQKWGRMSGLTLLLPHGYEGQGPEHSSARLERFLQLCAQENIQVCVPTTPSQYFHLLRRQALRAFRAPLVVITPKSLLRHPKSVSDREEFLQGSFDVLLDDERSDRQIRRCRRLVLCSGKVYYDLMAMVEEEKLSDVVICRLEQLYPFPHKELHALLLKYRTIHTIVWCQEEPHNQGGWHVLKDKIVACAQPKQQLTYAGREKMASSAPGDYKQFMSQQRCLVQQALGLIDNPFTSASRGK